MSRARPINADVPAPEAPPEPAAPKLEAKPKTRPGTRPKPKSPSGRAPRSKRHRRPVPGALKLVAGLVAVAIGFIVLAVVGGSGGTKEDGGEAPVPVLAAPEGGSEESAAPGATALGFPAFATGNTTRVGGADPAANAAAVALAAFPSTTPEQRPVAVTFVGSEDWAAGIAAAALVSPPLRAPVLVSAQGEAPEATTEALASLDPQGGPPSRGVSAFALGSVAAPVDGKVTRLRGGPPAAVAVRLARLRDRLFGRPPAHIVIASATRPEFAMPAAAWAARSADPVLFAGPRRLPKPTAAYLREHPNVPIYVVGPSAAISSDVVREAAAAGGKVRRVSGEDPVANAIALARYSDGGFGWNVNDPGHGFVLARAEQPLTAAAAAPLSASGTWGPLLLSDDAGTLPAELRSYFLDVKPGYTDNPTRAFYNHVWVIGDQEAIDVNQQAEANELAELAKIGDQP